MIFIASWRASVSAGIDFATGSVALSSLARVTLPTICLSALIYRDVRRPRRPRPRSPGSTRDTVVGEGTKIDNLVQIAVVYA